MKILEQTTVRDVSDPHVTTREPVAGFNAAICSRRGEDAHALPMNLYTPYAFSGRAAASLPRRIHKDRIEVRRELPPR